MPHHTSSMASRICNLKLAASTLAALASPDLKLNTTTRSQPVTTRHQIRRDALRECFSMEDSAWIPMTRPSRTCLNWLWDLTELAEILRSAWTRHLLRTIASSCHTDTRHSDFVTRVRTSSKAPGKVWNTRRSLESRSVDPQMMHSTNHRIFITNETDKTWRHCKLVSRIWGMSS